MWLVLKQGPPHPQFWVKIPSKGNNRPPKKVFGANYSPIMAHVGHSFTMFRILPATIVLFFFSQVAFSQSLGIGAQFGEPTGLTLRINNKAALGYDILAAWDFDNYLFVNVHGLWEHPLSGAPKVNYFYGPGVFAGFRERGRWKEDESFVGASATIGLNVYIQKLEIFGQLTPRLALAPFTDGDIGGGIGVRFYLN
jgi:hypothetical protein